jgi:hypothetical protein
MIDCLQMVLERLAADRDPVFDDEARLRGAERIPLDRVRGLSQLEIVDVLEIADAGAELPTQARELGLFAATPAPSLFT